jgi:hypothetical protein
MRWLQQHSWVDAATRAVTIDVNVWNPTLMLISCLKMQAEFSAVGKVGGRASPTCLCLCGCFDWG